MPTGKKLQMEISDLMEVSRLINLFDDYKGAISDRLDSFEEDYRAAVFFRDSGKHIYKYNVSKPWTHTFIENYSAAVTNILFDRATFWDVAPVEQFNLISPNIKDDAIANQLARVMNFITMNPDRFFFDGAESCIKELAYYGTAFSKCVEDYETENVDEFGGLLYVGPRLTNSSVFDTYPDPRTQVLRRNTDSFELEVVSMEELQDRERRGYKNLEFVTSDIIIPEDIKGRLEREVGFKNLYGQGFAENGDVFLMHYWDTEGHIKTIAGNKVVVFYSRDPEEIELPELGKQSVVVKPFNYYPWASLKINAPANELYGIGISKQTRQYQANVNRRGSERAENMELALQKVFVANEFHDLDIDNIIFGPGNIILAPDINNSIRVLDIGDITQSTYQEDQIEKQEAEDVAGIPEILRGIFPGGRQTAFTSNQVTQAAQGRIQAHMKRIAFWSRTIGKTLAMQIRTRMPQQMYERILGQQDAGFYQLEPFEIELSLDTRATSSALDLQRDTRIQNLVNVLQYIAQVQPGTPAYNLARKIIKETFPNEDPNAILPDGPQAPLQPPQPGQNQQALPGQSTISQQTVQNSQQ